MTESNSNNENENDDGNDLTDNQKKLAEKVCKALGKDASYYAPNAIYNFFDGLSKGVSPERSMFSVMLTFVCKEIDHGKLILIRRDSNKEIKTRTESKL